MISSNDGTVVSNKLTLSPITTLDEFRKTPEGVLAKKLVQNGDWTTLQILNDEIYGLSIIFNYNSLKSVKIFLKDNTSWGDWSEKKELEKKSKLESLLKQELGKPPYVFDWGTVESVFDGKGGSSSIIVHYT